MKLIAVSQISAQSSINRMCSGSACAPPASKQWFIAIDKQLTWQAWHASMQACISGVISWCIVSSCLLAPAVLLRATRLYPSLKPRVCSDVFYAASIRVFVLPCVMIRVGTVADQCWSLDPCPDNLPALFASLWGQLLLAKLALFAVMLGLAWANRFRLTPALAASIVGGDHARAVCALRQSLIFETAAALVILILVAWLGLLAPPMSDM